jgi:vacuolar-type H+-ATPase subunit F/Vma7
MDNLEAEYKIETYNFLMETYIETIHKLIDITVEKRILPLKIAFASNFIKEYVKDNRIEILEQSIIHILGNKETILNFDIANLDELDKDMCDNISVKSYLNKIKKTEDTGIIDLIIEIKNNSKTLSEYNIALIKKYFELMINILEKIKELF